MKPFDLQAAKAGAPIVTRDGRPAKFIAHVAEAHPNQRLLVLVGGAVCRHFEEGRCMLNPDSESPYDLFMAPVKRTVWVNLYEYGKAIWHDTEKIAERQAGRNRLGGRAWPIEIEE